jgi:Zn-dependent protease with chaperone function
MATTRVERRTFYEMQRRHRRSGWRFTALSALAVLCLGVPLSVLVSPFVLATGLIANDLANLVMPTPDLVGGIGEWFDEGTVDDPATPEDEGDVEIEPAAVGWITLGLIVPGMLGMLALWLAVRRLFLRTGAGAVEVAAGARLPRPDDVEERQLVNLVEEMALAAGVPPPRVRVVDSRDANAAVAGSSIHDATLIVPRGLLAELGRGPTGGVVADMLAVVVNGDLRAALAIASVFQTFGVVAALLAAPLSKRTRRALWRMLRLSMRRRHREADAVEVRFVAEELTYVGQLGGLDEQPTSGTLSTMATFPFMVANVGFTLVRLIFGGFVVAPVMAALWRRRRLLADATAVELTRDPTASPGPWTTCAAGGRCRHPARGPTCAPSARRWAGSGRWTSSPASGTRSGPASAAPASRGARRRCGGCSRPTPRRARSSGRCGARTRPPTRRSASGARPDRSWRRSSPRSASGSTGWRRWAPTCPTTRPRPGPPPARPSGTACWAGS